MTNDEPQIDLSLHGIPFVAIRVQRPDDTAKVAVLDDGNALTIAAPAPGETVWIRVESVDDHA